MLAAVTFVPAVVNVFSLTNAAPWETFVACWNVHPVGAAAYAPVPSLATADSTNELLDRLVPVKPAKTCGVVVAVAENAILNESIGVVMSTPRNATAKQSPERAPLIKFVNVHDLRAA
jgi:hypothetical protein